PSPQPRSYLPPRAKRQSSTLGRREEDAGGAFRFSAMPPPAPLESPRMKKLAVVLPLAFLLAAAGARADLTRYSSGSDVDARLRLHGPMLILDGGGGSDATAAYQQAIDRVRGCSDCGRKLDVVALRASGSDGYNSYFMGLKGVNSVVSLVITDRES